MQSSTALNQVKLAQSHLWNVFDPVVVPGDVGQVTHLRPLPGYLHALHAEVEVDDLGVGVVQLLRQEQRRAPRATSGHQNTEVGTKQTEPFWIDVTDYQLNY